MTGSRRTAVWCAWRLGRCVSTHTTRSCSTPGLVFWATRGRAPRPRSFREAECARLCCLLLCGALCGELTPARRLPEEPWKDLCIPPFLRRFSRGVSCSGALRVTYAFFHVNCTLATVGSRRATGCIIIFKVYLWSFRSLRFVISTAIIQGFAKKFCSL